MVGESCDGMRWSIHFIALDRLRMLFVLWWHHPEIIFHKQIGKHILPTASAGIIVDAWPPGDAGVGGVNCRIFVCVCVCVDGSIYTHRCVYVYHAPSGRVLACGRKLHAVPIRRDTTVEPLTPMNANRRANIIVSCWCPPPPQMNGMVRTNEFHRNGSSMCDRIQFLDKSLRERYEHALGLEWHTHTYAHMLNTRANVCVNS